MHKQENTAEYHTLLLPADADGVRRGAALLQGGQVVGMPTETVYGLAASAQDAGAVARIFAAKGRPGDNPLIVHIADMDMLRRVARPGGAALQDVKTLAAHFWPGPLTLVLPRTEAVPPIVSAGLDTVGVRMPSHPAALALIRAAGLPLAAPSANLSGKPSPTTAAHVMQDLKGRIPLVLDGGASTVGLESTVLSLAGEQPVVLRPGAITPAQLTAALGRPVAVAPSLNRPLPPGETAASPGMKYRHYAPKAEVTIVKGNHRQFAEYVAKHAAPGVFALCFHGEQCAVPSVHYGRAGDEPSQAAELFAALRTLDDRGARVVYARSPGEGGVGAAVYNRLLRAASFRVVEPPAPGEDAT